MQGGVDDVAEVGCMVAGGMAGLTVGNMLSAHVNPANFRKAMVVLIAMSAASLITSKVGAALECGSAQSYHPLPCCLSSLLD